MTPFQWFIVAFIVIAGLGYWNWQRTDQQIKQLQASGFTVSVDLKGSPRLLLDLERREVAVVGPTRHSTFSFTAVDRCEVIYDSGPEINDQYRIAVYLAGQDQPSEEIKYSDEWTAEEKLKKLKSFL